MLARVIIHLVDFARRRAAAVVAMCLVLAALAGVVAATRLGIDTDTNRLISPDLPWRQREAEIDRHFPQYTDLIAVVVDGATPDLAEDATEKLARRLQRDVPQLYKTVRRPDGDPFFHKHGLLFLSLEEVTQIAEQTIEAQGFVGALAADPSLRGLFGVLNQALEGVRVGAADLKQLEAPLGAIADAMQAALAGDLSRPLSWSKLFSGREPMQQELRRFILVQPVLDFAAFSAGERATTAIRAAARELGLAPERGVRIRLTGQVPLSDEEFATVAQGTGGATVASIALVCGLLFWALRQVRLVVAILVSLAAGLLVTGGFAALTVGTLNMVSVAFAVMFVGIAVDFAIQVAVRYRHERYRNDDPAHALWAMANGIGVAVAIAAVASAAGFLAFVPTAYTGVSELGLIAGVGMLIALVLNLTLLPALLTALGPTGVRQPVGWAALAPVDDWLLAHRRTVVIVTLLLAAGGGILLSRLEFDFNPLNLKDAKTESVATFLELMRDPQTTPQTATVLLPSVEIADGIARQLEALPEVAQVLTLNSFVPGQQAEKLAVIDDLRQIMGPTLAIPAQPPATAEDELVAAKRLVKSLAAVPGDGSPKRIAVLLEGLSAERLPALRAALLGGLHSQLASLRDALEAGPVTLANLPDALRRDWVAPDGRARAEIYPKGDSRDNEVLRRFVAAVHAVVPNVGGPPVAIQESAKTVVAAFQTAGLSALAAIAVILLLVLRHAGHVVLVLAPLVLAGLMTLSTATLIGLPLNFANIIALPLLLGVGVAFDIYFVMNWRRGEDRPLESSTTRAVVFSSLTTGTAFGSLALSTHPGTADMGKLLTIALAWTLVCTLLVLPALLGPPPRKA